MSKVISVDPGRIKCGLLLADLDQKVVLEAKVTHHSVVVDLIREWLAEGDVTRIVLGNGTTSKSWQILLRDFAPIVLVDERGSTFRSRNRYWELWPPNILWKWCPRSLMFPPKNLDAVAALVLLEDYEQQKFSWQASKDFKILI